MSPDPALPLGGISCQVPFCRRTARAERYPVGTEIICAKHWRKVSAESKARLRLVKRRRVRLDRAGRPLEQACRGIQSTWERCKAEAIEAAGGIA